MNPKDIRESSDPDLAGSYAAMMRAARAAEDLAIKTNTCLIVSIDGVDRRLTAEDLKKMSASSSAKTALDAANRRYPVTGRYDVRPDARASGSTAKGIAGATTPPSDYTKGKPPVGFVRRPDGSLLTRDPRSQRNRDIRAKELRELRASKTKPTTSPPGSNPPFSKSDSATFVRTTPRPVTSTGVSTSRLPVIGTGVNSFPGQVVPGFSSSVSGPGVQGVPPATSSTTSSTTALKPTTPLKPSPFPKSADLARQARANGAVTPNPVAAAAAPGSRVTFSGKNYGEARNFDTHPVNADTRPVPKVVSPVAATPSSKMPFARVPGDAMDSLRSPSAPGAQQMHLGKDGQWRPVADQAYKTPTSAPSSRTRMNPFENFAQQQKRQQKPFPAQKSLTGQTFQDFRRESLNQTPEERKKMLEARKKSGNFVDRNVARAKLLAERFKPSKPAAIYGRDLPARHAEVRVKKQLQGPGLPGTPIKIDPATVRQPQVKSPVAGPSPTATAKGIAGATQPKAPLKLVPSQGRQLTSSPVSQPNAKPSGPKSYQLPKGISDLLSKAKKVTGLDKTGAFLSKNSGKLGALGIGMGAYYGAEGAEAKGFTKGQGALIGGLTGDLETGLLKGRDGKTLSARGKVSEIGEGFSGLFDQEKTPLERLKSLGGASLNVLSFLDPKQILSMLGEAYDVKQDSTTGMTMGFLGDVLRGAGAGAAIGGPWGAVVGAIGAGAASATKIENYVPEEIQKESKRGDDSLGMLKGMTKEEKKKYMEFRKGNKEKIEKDAMTPSDQMDLFKNSPEGKAVIERLDKAKNSGQNGQGGDPSDPLEKIVASYRAKGTKISDKTKNQMKWNIEQGTVSAESYMQHASTGKLSEIETKRQKSEKGAVTSGNAEKLWRSQAYAAYNEGDEETGARLTAHADRNRDKKAEYEKDLKDSGGSITTAPPNTFDRNKSIDSNVNRQDPENPAANSGSVNFAVNVASANGQNPQAASVNFNPAQFEEFRTIVMQKFVDYSTQFDGVNNALRAIGDKPQIPTVAQA